MGEVRPVTIEQIRSFCAVNVCGSFTIAAESLYKTQPAISTQIKLLEEELGQKLFHRARPQWREISLTPAGEDLLPYARQILELQEEATKKIKKNNG